MELLKQLSDYIEQDSETNKEVLQKKILQASQNVYQNGMTFKDALGLEESQMKQFYKEAYRLYHTGKMKESLDIFYTLTTLEPTNNHYLFGFAACLHQMKDYKRAATYYTQAALYDSKNPTPYYHASDCFIHTNDEQSATLSLMLAVKRSGNKPEFKVMKDRAQMTLDTIKKEGLKKTKEKQKDEREDSSPTLEK